VFVSAAFVAIATSLVTYLIFALSPRGGDFSFMIAFGPAFVAFLIGGGITVAVGLYFANNNHG
jgi:hypothetical protein